MGDSLAAFASCVLMFSSKFQRVLAQLLEWIKAKIKRLPVDWNKFWEEYRPYRSGLWYLLIVLVIMLAGILVRWLFLGFPMRYDESYTVAVFAQRPWRNLVSDYSLPNNHIFHSILVKLSIGLFGSEPWAVRMPALICGILTIPVSYVLARQLYNRTTAVMSAGLVAALPILISYNTNSRGYSLYILCSVIIFSLAAYLLKHNNLVGWILFMAFATVGMYTVPFMVYPIGVACLWLFISALAGEARPAYRSVVHLATYILCAGVCIVLNSLLLYSPVILIGTGWSSLVRNPFVAPLPWADFWSDAGVNLINYFRSVNSDIPIFAQLLIGIGVLSSLIFHYKIGSTKVPLHVAVILWSAVMMIAMRRIMDRVLLFAVPLWLIWACGGLLAPFEYVKYPWKRLRKLVVAVVLIVITFFSYQRVHQYFPGWQNDPGVVEMASEYLSENLKEGDAVAVVFPNDAPCWYYLGQNGVADEFMHWIDTETHERVFVLVNRLYGETVESVLQAQGLDPEEYQAEAAEMVYEINRIEIYLCFHR